MLLLSSPRRPRLLERRGLMRQRRPVISVRRPFAGALGAKLYVGSGGPVGIVYRTALIGDGRNLVLVVPETLDAAVATAASPGAVLVANLPAALFAGEVWCQVRTHRDDVENDTLWRPRRLPVDAGGDGTATILGTCRVMTPEKRDDGGVLIRFVWSPARDGIQPEQFAVVKVTGAGAVATVALSTIGAGTYEADVTGLTDAVAYTFRIDAETSVGPVSVTVATGIDFTGDSSGPPPVTNATIDAG